MEKTGLSLIGIGPGNLDLMTKQAIDVSQSADIRFLEGYTSSLPTESQKELENMVGEWSMLMRPMMESADEILKIAENKKVAIMVIGDPMIATTHIDIRLRCLERGINFNYIPGISAISLAISTSGLQSYRFGRQITITYQYGEYLPISPLIQMVENRSRGLHTLALLDLDPTGMGVEIPVPMTPEEAGRILKEMAKKSEENVDDIESWNVLVCSDLGTFSERIIATTVGELCNIHGGRIHSLIFPSEMHEMENLAFNSWKIHS